MEFIRRFFHLRGSSGLLLIITACLALIIENSPYSAHYETLLTLPGGIHIGTWSLQKPLLMWINDGLMAIFFLLVSLELKREFLEGELSDFKKMVTPLVAAIGGIIGPAVMYLLINHNHPENWVGWAIPTATDIAFALTVASLLSRYVPKELKVLLVAIAIIDDIAAIAIIAFFYTANLSFFSLGMAVFGVMTLYILNREGVQSITPYILAGIFIWICVLQSGVHATLAGVVLGFFIPLKIRHHPERSPLKEFEKNLHPWVAYGILPIFAFANAGLPLSSLSLQSLTGPLSLGIICGLSFGAPMGITASTAIAVLAKKASLPNNTNWLQFMGLSCLTGIGFTMSLFIGTLAFEAVETQHAVRAGVLCGSLFAIFLGSSILIFGKKA